MQQGRRGEEEVALENGVAHLQVLRAMQYQYEAHLSTVWHQCDARTQHRVRLGKRFMCHVG